MRYVFCVWIAACLIVSGQRWFSGQVISADQQQRDAKQQEYERLHRAEFGV